MSAQSAVSATNLSSRSHHSRRPHSNGRPRPRMDPTADLPALTEDDDVFLALAAIDLLQRLEREPL